MYLGLGDKNLIYIILLLNYRFPQMLKNHKTHIYRLLNFVYVCSCSSCFKTFMVHEFKKNKQKNPVEECRQMPLIMIGFVPFVL